MRVSRTDFIRELGYSATNSDDPLYTALMLQPRIVAGITILGVVLQHGSLFFALAAVLLWSALVPAYNPFDAIYNMTIAPRRGLERLPAAPAPRRFAMAMAGTMSFVIGVALFAGVGTLAWPLEVMFAVAVAAVVFLNRCAGATVYHALHRRMFTSRRAGRSAAA